MAGNQQAYQTYMTAGHDAAWDQNWENAIRYYSMALKEFPEDSEAHNNLGLSLLRAERLADALRIYERAVSLSPEDPTPLEGVAYALEASGNLREASQRYTQVAELYLQQRDLEKAVQAWELAVQLTPGLIPIHAKLAQAHERNGDKKRALYHYLTLGYHFARTNQIDKGIKAIERALTLEPREPRALNAMAALRSGGEVLPPHDDNAPRHAPEAKRLDDDFGLFDEESGVAANTTGDPMGPMGEAMTQSLNLLAAYVLEQGMLDATGADALSGMELQRQDNREGAIAAYLRAVKALPHPALKMSLGGLLLLEDNAADAVKYLGDALVDSNLSNGAMHALGLAYSKLGKPQQAMRYLIQCLQGVETQRKTGNPDELNSTYSNLLEALSESNVEALQAINDRFLRTLTGEDWPQRVIDLRQHLGEIGGQSGKSGVPEFLSSEGGDELADTIARIDRYIREGRLVLAMDESHQAVEQAPSYLPAHVRMAEIMVKEGRLRQAINKYYIVARVYLIREDYDHAKSVLKEVIEMAPLDTTIRQELISVLEYQGQTEEALTHYIQLGQTYKQLGNVDGAREAYLVAEGIARRMNARDDLLLVKHAMADIDVSRLDTRRAQRLYEEILEINAEDEKAYRQLTEILLNQGNSVEAMRRLDSLLGMYAKNRQVNQIIKMLEDLVRLYSTEIGVRSRLAGIYRQMGRTDDAIKQLDTLGEIQLKAGLNQDAIVTIRQIVKMNPPNLEQYRNLLQQLEG
jgi:tetratricopeptide (TPR) repeat protein